MHYNMYRRTYNVINDILEFGYLMEHHHQRPLTEIPFDKLEANQKLLEQELDLQKNPYQLYMPALLEKLLNATKVPVFGIASEDQLRSVAKFVIDAGKYPNAELKYVLAYFMAHQLFEKRCKDNSLELKMVYERSLDEYFTRPTRYTLVRKNQG